MSEFHKNLVNQYIQDLHEAEDSSTELTKVSISVNLEDLALIDAVATLFEKSRSEVMCTLFRQSCKELFESLPKSRRLNIALMADSNYKSGLTKIGYDPDDIRQIAFLTLAQMERENA